MTKVVSHLVSTELKMVLKLSSKLSKLLDMYQVKTYLSDLTVHHLNSTMQNVKFTTTLNLKVKALLFVLLQNKSTTLKNWLTNTQSSLSKMVWMKTIGKVGNN